MALRAEEDLGQFHGSSTLFLARMPRPHCPGPSTLNDNGLARGVLRWYPLLYIVRHRNIAPLRAHAREKPSVEQGSVSLWREGFPPVPGAGEYRGSSACMVMADRAFPPCQGRGSTGASATYGCEISGIASCSPFKRGVAKQRVVAKRLTDLPALSWSIFFRRKSSEKLRSCSTLGFLRACARNGAMLMFGSGPNESRIGPRRRDRSRP